MDPEKNQHEAIALEDELAYQKELEDISFEVIRGNIDAKVHEKEIQASIRLGQQYAAAFGLPGRKLCRPVFIGEPEPLESKKDK